LPKPKKKPENLRNTTLAKITQVLQTPTLKKAVQKLHKNQKADLDNAIKELIKDPLLEQQKKGDLSFLRVYKFEMVKQLISLGYSYKDGTVTVELMALGSHENFYRDLKDIF
jgi:mRNA-degrading endonuclease RelE of RelBE toxin-antitoxin system